jgi:hypothetical protein
VRRSPIEYWTRQWALIDPRVEPRHVTVGSDERIYVDAHQVVRDLGGAVLRDQMVQHVYTLEGGRAKWMEIREEVLRARNGKKTNEE